MRSQTRILTLTAAGIATAGVVWWMAGAPPSKKSLDDKKTATPVVEDAAERRMATMANDNPPPSNARVSQSPPPTLRGRYALSYNLEMASGEAQANQKASMKLEATLVASVDAFADADGIRWVWVELEDPALTMNDTMKTLVSFGADRRSDFSKAFAIRLLPNGRIDDVRFASEQSASAQATLANIAQAAQLVVSNQGPSTATEEWSLNGPVQAVVEQARADTYKKHWHRTEETELAGKPIADGSQANQGVVTVTIDGNSALIKTVQSKEVGRPRVGSSRTPTYSIAVSLIREGDAASRVAKGVRREALSPLVPALLDFSLPQEPTLTYAEALQNVRDAGTDLPKRAAARRQLAQVITSVSGSAQKVATVFAAPSTPRPIRLTLIESLAGAKTQEAHQAIVDLIQDTTLEEPLRVEVVGAIVAVPEPSDLLLGSLAEIAYSDPDRVYASKVAMVLGASISLQAENDAAAAARHLGLYVARAAEVLEPPAAGEPPRLEERSNWLGGLGNVGSPAALPLILQGLEDSREEIRAGAAHALRFQDPPTVYERMQQLMHQDDAMPVRLGVLHSAHYMGPAVTKGLVERALHYDPSENVRNEAAYVIAAWVPDAPGLRQVLAHALARETSEKVRHTLRNYLQPGRVATPARQIPTVNELIPADYQSEAP